ncbi:MAG: iron-regulated protein [Zoogloeaceae bacterium]|nr:iron-regulated protein [Rhodocyclaceae bacterium]MCP5232559.1 iron-regulated protein [Zoogloeaceae bacterium]MCP5238687.1 iron-regulated protein [Zoogloeaceae bacterium]MCP5254382.1 iron-regulated protein [Zoogloeaceae bacterium]MCP5295836.1 iron-regulated protein [Zoogloeaceae bacterium]
MRSVKWFSGFVLAAGVSFAALAAPAVTPGDVLVQYGEIVHAAYADTLDGAKRLQKAVDEFVVAPSEKGLTDARLAWLAGREWYGQTEAFRFYGGPIDGEGGPEGRINGWPMDEAYVDGVEGHPHSGIVNDRAVAIDAPTLAELNEKDGEENIATGWHAIEFLLWGQDRRSDGPGNRAYTEFLDGQAANADRRRAYLKVVTDLLVSDLSMLEAAWAPSAQNYRSRFVARPENLPRIVSALGILSRGELAGERIEVALDSQSQEDEHSCFSDNTHRDVVNNALGIRNVWRGEYLRADGTRLTGPSLRDLVAGRDKAVAARLDVQMDAAVSAAEAIPAPFDQAILVGSNGRKAVEATVAALKTQTGGLLEAAQALGIKRLTTTVPE